MSAAMERDWFQTSKTGLAKIARRRGLSYVLLELVQNAWDTGAKNVEVTFQPVDGRPSVDIFVEDDDPDGFKDISHAWTLFAESDKKVNPQKRGKFNMGEKLVLAVCESAQILTTTGEVRFDDDGRHVGRKRSDKGSCFSGRIRMTREELAEVLATGRRLISPPDVVTTINKEPLAPRKRLKEFVGTLATDIANEEGYLVRRGRSTSIHVYEAMLKGEDGRPEGWLYEMGIPICAIGDRWDVDIQQKVPLNMERNSVPEAYLRDVRVYLLNEMYTQLRPEDAKSVAVQAAMEDSRVKPEAVDVVLTHRFGEKRAVWDPSDLEANRRLTAEGFTVIPGGTFTKAAWENIRDKPSGQIRPTPKPYSDDPNAEPARFIPEDEWTEALKAMAEYAQEYGWRLIRKAVRVRFERNRMTSDWIANYGAGCLIFNHDRLGKSWFEQGPRAAVNELLIHEFAHDAEHNHLSTDFYKALQKLGARSTELALAEPEFFTSRGYKPVRH
jgi:hypothetical protein